MKWHFFFFKLLKMSIHKVISLKFTLITITLQTSEPLSLMDKGCLFQVIIDVFQSLTEFFQNHVFHIWKNDKKRM